jgi:hypothetical protein
MCGCILLLFSEAVVTYTPYVLNIRNNITDNLTHFGLRRSSMQGANHRNFSMKMAVAVSLCILMILPSSMGAELATMDYDADVRPIN